MAVSWLMVFLIASVEVSIFFKPMLEDFGWDRATLASVQSVALIIFAIASPLLGRLIDRFGPRVMIFACVAAQVLSSVINGAARNIGHLYLARFLNGINVLPSTQVLMNRWFVRRRGTVLGFVATGRPIGLIILAPISQFLILLWGWRPTMFFWAGVTLIIVLPLALLIRNSPEDKGYGPDGDPPSPSTGPVADSNAMAPVKPMVLPGSGFGEATRTGAFWLVSSAHLICGIGCGFMMTHIVIFATDVGLSDIMAASLLSIEGGADIAGILVAGYLSDRMARNRVLALIHFIRTLSFVIIIIFILLGSGSPWMLYTAMVFFGFGWYTTAPLTAGLVADLFGSLRLGTILGFTTGAHMFGMALGAYAGGIIYERLGSYYLFFVVITGLSLLASIFPLFIRPKGLSPAVEAVPAATAGAARPCH
ncbi:MAG: MFS transporter [Chloroflexota bacterium]